MMKVPVCQNTEKIVPCDALETASQGEVITGTETILVGETVSESK